LASGITRLSLRVPSISTLLKPCSSLLTLRQAWNRFSRSRGTSSTNENPSSGVPRCLTSSGAGRTSLYASFLLSFCLFRFLSSMKVHSQKERILSLTTVHKVHIIYLLRYIVEFQSHLRDIFVYIICKSNNR